MRTSNIKKIINHINKNIFYSLIIGFLLVILLQKNQTGFNVYYIFTKDHDARLAKNYEKKFYSGYCEKQSHGYIINIKNSFPKKFDKNSIPKIINLENRNTPYWIFADIGYKIDDKKIILLNYEETQNKKINLANYKILDNFKNKCLFIEKND